MKYFVTGGAGFIGSNFIKFLLKTDKSIKIINYDKLTYAGNLENLAEIENDSRYSFIKGDIADALLVDKSMSGSDIVVNFAAETHVDRSIGDPADFIKTDVEGAYVLLESAKKHNVKNFIQISTDEVYGSIEKGSFNEGSPLNPTNPYSASKSGADRLAFSYWATYKLPVIITRASNNYGPNQYPEKIIPLFVTNALEGKELPLYGDGMNVRDWLYVEDHCRALVFLIEKGKHGEVYNIGGGNEITNRDLTEKILSILDKPASLIKKVTDRMGHDKRYSLDCGKLLNLGWKQKTDFHHGLEKTVEWYVKNEDWWKRIKTGRYLEYYRKQYGNR
ncbi:MAG: dTDP-glucose 4,6-dehydratase [Candidatus Aureabacteria bacterium]|nr:dTDP-glucose 4,6-dehydratase [Candidatus Auribacterota bacterium]